MAELIQPAPFLRRLGAAFYDFLLLLALWICAGFIAVLIHDGHPEPAGTAAFQGVLLGIAMLFNGWFWTHGGQTLGMRAWRLQIRQEDGGGAIGWGRAGVRFVFAVLAWGLGGIGVLWALAHPQNKTWQDLLSGTETIVLPPPKADQVVPK